jgi:DNA polymerase
MPMVKSLDRLAAELRDERQHAEPIPMVGTERRSNGRRSTWCRKFSWPAWLTLDGMDGATNHAEHKVTIDFEMYSECDLKTHGLSRYMNDPSTQVYMMAWKINDGPKHLWMPWDNMLDPMPAELEDAILAGFEVHAFNAAFEIIVWRLFMVRQFGWIPIPSCQWRCTMAKCGYANLPRSLKQASRVLELGDDGKDVEGHKLMMKMCRPQRGKRVFNVPMQLALGEYCKQDVHAESLVDQQTPTFPARELTIWRLDRKINDRGVPVDLNLCRGAVKILAEANKLAVERLSVLTAGKITSVNQIAKLKEFVAERASICRAT